ncbi:MAG TPA: SGNH/GDSL hydrolase family protein [Planctomycetota bacterium]|nr:SGNH/GDSL hydrolase family protein [Planctomycetota bacterium]
MARASLQIRKHDRIVFLGDSITDQQLYTNQVEAYLATRYPELGLEFVNVGWGGDTVGKALVRLERDVIALKPTLVTICLGMNDGGYCPPTAAIAQTFAEGLGEIVRRLKKARVRVVLMTPGFADVVVNPNLERVDYNRRGLRVLADRVLAVAKREKLPCVDLHELMNEVDARAKSSVPGFTMAQDGFHPEPAGHLVMAYGLLQALGVPPWRREIVIDAHRRTGRCADGKVRLEHDEDGITIEVELDQLPFYVEPDARRILPHLPMIEDFASIRLVVRGLDAGAWQVRSGGFRAERDAADFAGGIELGTLWDHPSVRAAQSLRRFVDAKARAFFQCWREIALDGTDGAWFENRAALRIGARMAAALDGQRGPLQSRGRRTVRLRLFPRSVAGDVVADSDFIPRWALAGPLPAPWARDALDGEAGCSVPGAALPGAWQSREIDIATPGDNLQGVFGPNQQCFAYACVEIESPAAQRVELLVGSDDGVAAWLNGDRVLAKLDAMRGVAPDQERVPVRLKAGANRLLLKITQHAGNWGFCVRFAGLKRALRIRAPQV